MKILVFSDSHGNPACIRAALDAHRGSTDLVFFLGDGVRDITDVLADFPEIPRVIVAGNCDSPLTLAACGIDAPTEEIRTVDGLKILAMHGHTARVKWGYDSLIYRASEVGADIVLFGHTHLPENHFVNDPGGVARRILLFNPGSIGTGMTHSYGVIYVIGGQISADHGYARL